MSIIYLTGDATRPRLGSGDRLILHVVNAVGAWGRGFVLSLSKRWVTPEACYREWHRTGRDVIGGDFKLGNIQPVKVEQGIVVVNMLAQKYISGTTAVQGEGAVIPLSYDALAICLSKVKTFARARWTDKNHVTLHAPKLGCGLAGGRWENVAKLLEGTLKEFDVYIYTPEGVR